MKTTATTLIAIFFALAIQAQNYSFTITPDGAGKFTLDVENIINASRRSIERTLGLDTLSLQRLQYSRIERAYQDIAAAQVEADKQQQYITTLRASLAGLGLEGFNAAQIIKYDSTFIAGWTLQNTAGRNLTLSTQYRPGNTSVLRDVDAAGATVATIIPLSTNYIRLNISEAYRDGSAFVLLYTADGRRYVGTAGEVRYRFIRQN
jgi:hypothetical protein